jgi:carbonic anhydrase
VSGTDPFEDLLAANAEHQRTFGRPREARAARGLALVTCMDSRIDPLGMLGLVAGDAKIIRTAGARVTQDALQALVLAYHLLGVDRVMVVAHTECAMARMSEDALHAAVLERSGVDTRSLHFGAVQDQQAALELDVRRVRSSPYLSPGLPVIGAVYNVRTGALKVTVS